VGTGPLDEIAFTNNPSVDHPEVEDRKGDVLRIVTSRHVDAICRDCPRTFGHTGAAASHARASRHRIRVHYTTEFEFLPLKWVTS
jgi:hypothetical protein